jgi:uncharacterized protein YrrD
MQNAQQIKWSELRGIAIVSLSDGKKIGTVDDFYFDPASQRILALRVKTGLLGHRIFSAASINTIGRDAITTPNEETLQHESDSPQLTGSISGENLTSYRVMSENGTVVGKIGNLFLTWTEPTAPMLFMLELSGGLLEGLTGKHQDFPASQVLRYGTDVIVIPDNVGQQLQTH